MSEPRYRFKHLVQTGVDASSQPWKTDETDLYGRKRPGPPPASVDAENGDGTLAEIEAHLRERRLFPQDLVDLGRGWETIADTPELGALAETLPQPGPGMPRWLIQLAVVAVISVLCIAMDRRVGANGWLMLFGILLILGWRIYMLFATLLSNGKSRPSVTERPFDEKKAD